MKGFNNKSMWKGIMRTINENTGTTKPELSLQPTMLYRTL